MSVWEYIYDTLIKDGFDVYPPGIKLGDCISKYVVVKSDGSSQHSSFSTDVDLYAIMCYVPKQKYSELEPFVLAVKNSMKQIKDCVMPYGQQTPSFYDDSIKAHMVSIEYKNYKKL